MLAAAVVTSQLLTTIALIAFIGAIVGTYLYSTVIAEL